MLSAGITLSQDGTPSLMPNRRTGSPCIFDYLKNRGWEREVPGPVRGTIGQRGPRELCAPGSGEEVRKPLGGPGGQALEGKPRAGVVGWGPAVEGTLGRQWPH